MAAHATVLRRTSETATSSLVRPERLERKCSIITGRTGKIPPLAP